MDKSKIEQYYTQLNIVEERLEELDKETANQLLDQLFKIKPVRLKWYLVKGKLMLKEGKSVDTVVEFLMDKCAPWYLYEGVEEYFQLLIALSEYKGDALESRRYTFWLNRMKEVFQDKRGENDKIAEERNKWVKKTLEMDKIGLLEIEKLKELYYISGNIYLYLLWEEAGRKLYGKEGQTRPWILGKVNVGYFYERLISQEEDVFIVMATSDEMDCQLTAKVLKELGKKVFLLEKPILQNAINGKTLENSVQIPHIKEKKGILTVKVWDRGEKGDNRGELLEYIVNNYTKDGLATILGSGLLLDQMSMEKKMQPKLERLTQAEADYLEENMAVGRYGDYLAYIAQIYKMPKTEVKNSLLKKTTCRFTIIIPCRDGIHTLHSTLKTCLNQSYKGRYEVLVSDNWDVEVRGESPIYDICQSFHDNRIKYYKAPRNLSLMKNFEYAFLKAEGEFLIAMGADDGILPWALEEFERVLQRYPERLIFTWIEENYKWSDVLGGYKRGEAGKAVLTGHTDFQLGNPETIIYPAKDVFLDCFEEYGHVTYLPQLYHNSGIRREYLSILYETTGVLWAGISQDICMAVTIGNIEDTLCFITTPLTVSGMSGDSIGCQCVVGNTSYNQKSIEEKMKSTFQQGMRVQGYKERLFPITSGFMSGFYACVMYGNAIGCIDDKILEERDWKEMYRKVAIELQKQDILYDAKLHRLRYAVSLLGEEVLEWFDQAFYHDALELATIGDEDEHMENSPYSEVIIIDEKRVEAEPESIIDIYKATLFLENMKKIKS